METEIFFILSVFSVIITGTHANVYRLPDMSAHLNNVLLFLNQNICCGYSKEPSQ